MDEKIKQYERKMYTPAKLETAIPEIDVLISYFNKKLRIKCPNDNLLLKFNIEVDEKEGKICLIRKIDNNTEELLSSINLKFYFFKNPRMARFNNIMIESETNEKYTGRKYNQLLRAICVYVFTKTLNDYNMLTSIPINPISSYLLMSRFNYELEWIIFRKDAKTKEERNTKEKEYQRQYEEIKNKTGNDTWESVKALFDRKMDHSINIPFTEENKKKADVIIHDSLLNINGKLRCPSDEKLQGGTSTNKIVSTILTYPYCIAVIILFVLLLIYIVQNYTEYTVFNSFNNPIDKYINNIL